MLKKYIYHYILYINIIDILYINIVAFLYTYIYSTFNIAACQAMQLDPVGNLQKIYENGDIPILLDG